MLLTRHVTPRPLHLLAVVAGGLLLVYSASVPIVDIDLWWHRRLGVEILDQQAVSGLGNSWAPFGDQDWTTTQWLAEVMYAWLYSLGGFSAITAVRLVAGLLILVFLGWTVLRGRSSLTAVPVYVTAVFGLALFIVQDRPQTLALVGAVVLGGWLDHILNGDRSIPAWQVGLLTWVWANLHGSWLLVPAVLALAALALLVERRTPLARATGIAAAVAAGAGLLTPAGLSSALAPLRFTQRTTFLGEWNQVELLAPYGIPLALMAASAAVCWARADTVPRAEAVVVLGVSVFALTANRNIPFGIVLLAPLLASIAGRSAHPQPDRSPPGTAVLAGSLAVVLATAAIVTHSRVDPAARAEPRVIASVLGQEPGTVRVLNTYEAAGVLLEFSGGNVELGIDGRADRYDPDFVARYFGAVYRLEDVDGVLETIRPQAAVLRQSEPLATHLQSRGWVATHVDGDYVLMEARPTERGAD